jgi:hypothetical protein
MVEERDARLQVARHAGPIDLHEHVVAERAAQVGRERALQLGADGLFEASLRLAQEALGVCGHTHQRGRAGEGSELRQPRVPASLPSR